MAHDINRRLRFTKRLELNMNRKKEHRAPARTPCRSLAMSVPLWGEPSMPKGCYAREPVATRPLRTLPLRPPPPDDDASSVDSCAANDDEELLPPIGAYILKAPIGVGGYRRPRIVRPHGAYDTVHLPPLRTPARAVDKGGVAHRAWFMRTRRGSRTADLWSIAHRPSPNP